jgi:hypothetical protein
MGWSAQRLHLGAHPRALRDPSKGIAVVYSISQLHSVHVISEQFLPSPGDAVRALAVEHSLLPESYPRGDSLAAVLSRVDLSLFSAPDRWPEFGSSLTRLAAQNFGPEDAQTVGQWVDFIWASLTPSTGCTMLVDEDDSLLFIPMVDVHIHQLEESETLSRMDDLRQKRRDMLASVDDMANSRKKQVLLQWVSDVHASGLQAHQRALLIEEFSARLHNLEPAEVKESAWNLCIGSVEKMASADLFDPVLNDGLLQLVATLPVLTQLRYTNNPHVALAQCRETMREAGYPQVVSALYLAAARQLVTSLAQEAKQCHLAVSHLGAQIRYGKTRGDQIPVPQMVEILGPVLAKAVFGSVP